MAQTYTCGWCTDESCAHCPWCGLSTPEHTVQCPVELGVYPIDDEHVGALCGSGLECGTVFGAGEQYSYLVLPDGRHGMVCLGCAARIQLGIPDRADPLL